MQGKQNAGNTERKGPHKSMHCKFCKPPGAVVAEKPNVAQLETKTRIHLIHEGADLRLCNIHDEPGFPTAESEACMCILEGENSCPKCVPDKNRPPPKKKVCRCPKGAKPHPSMYNEAAPKKKKPMDEDDEFWWEKYSREHDAIAKETWAAYMAQRRKDKKVIKCQRCTYDDALFIWHFADKEYEHLALKMKKGIPFWYQKLSCQQMIYIEFLSTAIRLDSDENITDRTHFVLGGIGLYPRPSRKFLKKCLRYCHYNAVQFLNQLHMLTKDLDPYEEKYISPSLKQKNSTLYTWNEKLIMNSICYLEFPAILRELMDRLPPLPREKILPQIPYPVFPTPPKKKYPSPYEEPIWQDRLNWLEKMKIDRLNRCRAHMETKRIKIPPLALVRRASLIDARPPFLAQIEANERASRRIVKEKKKRPLRKHPISTFNSAVDVTAIAGIEASEISTTDKADTDDICVFLREPKESESTEGGITEEESDFTLTKEVRFLEEATEVEDTQGNRKKTFFDLEENSVIGEEDADDIPFKTPPKTESGATISSPCPPPDATPGPPAFHFDSGKRELDIINEEICRFFPFASSSRHTVKEDEYDAADDIELKLKSAAAKLKKLTKETGQDAESKKPHKKKKIFKKKGKCKKGKNKKKTKQSEARITETPDQTENVEENMDNDEKEDWQENYPKEEDYVEEEDDIKVTYKQKERYISSRESEISDPDPDTDDDWPTRPPCTPDASQFEEQKKPLVRRKLKKKGKTSKRKPRKKKILKGRSKGTDLEKETGVHEKKRDRVKEPQETNAMETKVEDKEILSSKNQESEKEEKDEKEEEKENEEKERHVFKGEVEPLVKKIIDDLADEGFCCASYPNVNNHPDIQQLILHLKGKILNKELKKSLFAKTKLIWNSMKGLQKLPIPELGISKRRIWSANWNDKKWISKLAKSKIDQFYYKVARSRAEYGGEIYNTLNQTYFGTDRYLKIFYAYMTSKYEDAILRGII